MREFRGKRIDGNNNWAYGNLIISGDKAYIISKDNVIIGENNTLSNTSVQPVKLETIGQFTGLLDKNGKEIFKGDVIAPWPYKTNSNYKLEVAFRFGMFILKAKKPFMPKYKSLHEAMINAINANAEYEIISSIHDKE